MFKSKRQIEELMNRVEAQKESAHIHKPYAETWRRKPDFEVEYQFDIDPSKEYRLEIENLRGHNLRNFN